MLLKSVISASGGCWSESSFFLLPVEFSIILIWDPVIISVEQLHFVELFRKLVYAAFLLSRELLKWQDSLGISHSGQSQRGMLPTISECLSGNEKNFCSKSESKPENPTDKIRITRITCQIFILQRVNRARRYNLPYFPPTVTDSKELEKNCKERSFGIYSFLLTSHWKTQLYEMFWFHFLCLTVFCVCTFACDVW